jgi:hypothetical protein
MGSMGVFMIIRRHRLRSVSQGRRAAEPYVDDMSSVSFLDMRVSSSFPSLYPALLRVYTLCYFVFAYSPCLSVFLSAFSRVSECILVSSLVMSIVI